MSPPPAMRMSTRSAGARARPRRTIAAAGVVSDTRAVARPGRRARRPAARAPWKRRGCTEAWVRCGSPRSALPSPSAPDASATSCSIRCRRRKHACAAGQQSRGVRVHRGWVGQPWGWQQARATSRGAQRRGRGGSGARPALPTAGGRGRGLRATNGLPRLLGHGAAQPIGNAAAHVRSPRAGRRAHAPPVCPRDQALGARGHLSSPAGAGPARATGPTS